jgi:hypothetical protein
MKRTGVRHLLPDIDKGLPAEYSENEQAGGLKTADWGKHG